MQTNKNGPNSERDIQETISNVVGVAGNPSLRMPVDVVGLVADKQVDGIGLLRNLVKDVDQPVLRSLGMDMINLLGSFYGSQEVLCCLIKNIIAMATGAESVQLTREEFNRRVFGENALHRLFAGVDDPTISNEITVSDTNLGVIIDQLILIIDAIIIFLEADVQDIALPVLDIGNMLLQAIMGAVIIALQQVVFTLRDLSVSWVLGTIQDNIGDQPWLKCLPFMDFVKILRKYIHDYGMLDKLFKMIKGFIGSKYAKFSSYLQGDLVENVRLLEFLKWLRGLLIQIKNAAINWELCFDTDQGLEVMPSGVTGSIYDTNNLDDNTGLPKSRGNGRINDNLNSTLGDDNTILRNTADNMSEVPFRNAGGYRPPSNDEINNFLKSNLGMSDDLADQLTGFTNARDHVDGTLAKDSRKVNNDCGFSMDDRDVQDAVRRALRNNGLL